MNRAHPSAIVAPLLGSLVFGACSNQEPAQTLPTLEVSTRAPSGSSLARTSAAAVQPSSAAPSSSGSSSGVAPTNTSTNVDARTRATADSSSSPVTTQPTGTSGTSTGASFDTSLGTTTDTSSSVQTDSTDSNTGTSSSTGKDTKSGETGNSKDPTCLPLCEKGSQDAFVDCVVEFKPAPETAHYVESIEKTDPKTGKTVVEKREYFGWNHDKMPQVVLGPPKGSFDTVSLGCEGSLTVGFVDPPLTDGPGADLIVFENPFAPSFPEPLKVEVSDDACTWHAFPCNPVTLEGCGGLSVVKALPKSGIDPTDPKVAGGDAFDLADIGVARARFVRVTSVSREYWLAKEQTEKWCDPSSLTTGKGGSDIDAFAFVHASTVATGE